MIDFRYHLVSLVAVFLALAVGIVLGAGPLRDSIGDTLSSQVDLLREDRADLQQRVDELSGAVERRNAFVAGVAPALLANQLTDRSAVLVALPGAQEDLVDDLRRALTAAGAEVTGSVALQAGWTDPDRADARGDVVAGLPAAGGEGVPDAAGTPAALARALADTLTTGEPAQAGTPAPTGRAVLDALASADLVTVDGEPVRQAQLAVVVAPAPAAAPGHGDASWADAEGAAGLAVTSALAEASGGVVLTGPLAAAGDEGAIATLRADDLAARASGVDTVDNPAGVVTTILALAEQAEGGVGQYGFGEGAEEVVPPIPTVVTPPTPPDQPIPVEPTPMATATGPTAGPTG